MLFGNCPERSAVCACIFVIAFQPVVCALSPIHALEKHATVARIARQHNSLFFWPLPRKKSARQYKTSFLYIGFHTLPLNAKNAQHKTINFNKFQHYSQFCLSIFAFSPSACLNISAISSTIVRNFCAASAFTSRLFWEQSFAAFQNIS